VGVAYGGKYHGDTDCLLGARHSYGNERVCGERACGACCAGEMCVVKYCVAKVVRAPELWGREV